MRTKALTIVSVLTGIIFLLVLACQKPGDEDPLPQDPKYKIPQLPAVAYNYASLESEIPPYLLSFIQSNPAVDNTPGNNPITNEGATLGRVLFYDKQLSVNNTIACASCHHQDKAFTDGRTFSEGFDKGFTRRNAMSITNLRYFKAKKMFWDLRAESLEAQALMPIQDLVEMGMPSLAALETKLKGLSYYPSLFNAAFGSTEITSDKISKALSQFMRSIISFNSKYDQGLANNFANFTQQELDGKALVIRAFCTECHSDLVTVAGKKNPTFLMVENSGQNTGFGSNNALDVVYTDNGIGEKTNKTADMGTFKIPTLRNVELTAPYMHDGRFASLEQVVDHYATGVKNHPNRGIQIVPNGFKFSDKEKNDIIAFLKTLTDQSLKTNVKYADPFPQ